MTPGVPATRIWKSLGYKRRDIQKMKHLVAAETIRVQQMRAAALGMTPMAFDDADPTQD